MRNEYPLKNKQSINGKLKKEEVEKVSYPRKLSKFLPSLLGI